MDTYLPLLSIRSFANPQQNHEKIRLHMMFLSLLPNVPQTMEPNGYKVEDTIGSKLAHMDIYKLGNNSQFLLMGSAMGYTKWGVYHGSITKL
jgi:hypothetical protein